MFALGAASGTVLLLFVIAALTVNDPISIPEAILALLGVIGLWLASFQDPSNVSHKSLYVVVLLVCGLIAESPWLVATFGGFLKEPPKFRDIANSKMWFVLWLFVGPALCAVYFLTRQVIARIRHAQDSGI